MKRRVLVEMEVEVMDGHGPIGVEVMDGHGPIGVEDLAIYLEADDAMSMVRVRDVTVWKTTDDYLADLGKPLTGYALHLPVVCHNPTGRRQREGDRMSPLVVVLLVIVILVRWWIRRRTLR